jgi:3-hydroxyacyl-[acyl-carrier-protein] dehydratase
MLDINQIKEYIPHRFPFLLVDRILEIETGVRAVGIKNITSNDYYCQYFSDSYLFSGALQVEAMAQVSAFIVMDMIEDKTQTPYFACIDGARFRKVVKPGDQLMIEVVLKKFKANTGKFKAKTYIDGEVASEAMITCMLSPE